MGYRSTRASPSGTRRCLRRTARRRCCARRFGLRPGPRHLEVPADMYTEDAGDEPIYREENLGKMTSRRLAPDRDRIGELVDRLVKAERPLIVAGHGVIISEAWDELRAFAEALGIPVATSLGGKGSIAENHDLAVGVIGRNSRRVGNDAVRACDVVLAIGTRLGGLATHRWQLPFDEKRILQIDSDPLVVGHNHRIELSVIADAKLALERISEGLNRGRIPKLRGL